MKASLKFKVKCQNLYIYNYHHTFKALKFRIGFGFKFELPAKLDSYDKRLVLRSHYVMLLVVSFANNLKTNYIWWFACFDDNNGIFLFTFYFTSKNNFLYFLLKYHDVLIPWCSYIIFVKIFHSIVIILIFRINNNNQLWIQLPKLSSCLGTMNLLCHKIVYTIDSISYFDCMWCTGTKILQKQPDLLACYNNKNQRSDAKEYLLINAHLCNVSTAIYTTVVLYEHPLRKPRLTKYTFLQDTMTSNYIYNT